MNVQLKENGLLRSIFNLDEVEVEDGQKAKGNRFERVCFLINSHFNFSEIFFFQQLANKAAFKLRTQALKKTRANKETRSQQEEQSNYYFFFQF